MKRKIGALGNCIDFIDGTGIEIARPGGGDSAGNIRATQLLVVFFFIWLAPLRVEDMNGHYTLELE